MVIALNKMMRTFILLLFSIFSFSQESMSQNFELSRKILKKSITEYDSFFLRMGVDEAREKGLSYKYNYYYCKETLTFIGYRIENLALRVVDDKIVKVYFEIPYNDEGIIREIIETFGPPDVGHKSLDINSTKELDLNKDSSGNYLYESYTGLTWTKDNEDTFMHITNLKNNKYFLDKESVLWVSFNIVKD